MLLLPLFCLVLVFVLREMGSDAEKKNSTNFSSTYWLIFSLSAPKTTAIAALKAAQAVAKQGYKSSLCVKGTGIRG